MPTQQADNLQRFLDAQQSVYAAALAEVKRGRKQSHWMWFIFPQIHGLGFSDISKRYAIKSKVEAEEFIQHPILGARLISICNELLELDSNDAQKIFGTPDDLKLRSSMTLFSSLPNTNPVFEQVLSKFFGGIKDNRTLQIMKA